MIDWPARLATAALGVLGAVCGAAGIRCRFFDYDEIYHAHATWLMAQGDRPFHDFFASHSPLPWFPLSALWLVLPSAPASLLHLRVVGCVGVLLSIVAMALAWTTAHRDIHRTWLVAGIGVVALHPAVVDYAIEFRPDAWATAVVFLACAVLFGTCPASVVRRCGAFGALAGLGALASPKVAMLPVLVVLVDLVRRRWGTQGSTREALAGYSAGAGASLLVVVGGLGIAGVDPELAFQMAVRYQWTFAADSAFGYGLLAAVTGQATLLAIVSAGLLARVVLLSIRRRRPGTFETALVLFLVLQCLLVDRPYKQYYAPWFLAASCFVPYVGELLQRRAPAMAPWALASLLVAAAVEAGTAAQSFVRDGQAPRMLAYYDELLAGVPADARVLAYPPLHPIVRRDVFYAWNRTTDPAGRGTAAVMRAMQVPGYAERFTSAHQQRELASRPPAVVVAPVDAAWGYEPEQWRVVRAWLDVHRDEYVALARDVMAPAWVRRDLVARELTREHRP